MAKGRTVGIIIGWIGTALATAALAGGGVYLWQSKQVDELKQGQDALQRQITELQSGDDSIGRDDDGQDLLAEDDRRLLSFSEEEGYGIDNLFYCQPDDSDSTAFNLDDPTTTVLYASELGYSLEVPWNPDWGTERCRVNEYDDISSGDGQRNLLFGPLIAGEGGLGRMYVLRSLPARSADEAVAAIEDEVGADFLTEGPEVDQMAGFDVVVYAYSGLCDAFSVEVVGSGDYNYALSSGCNTPPFEDDRAVYESILDGFEIL